MIIPHVLIDLERHSRPRTSFDQPPGLAIRHRQWLLREDSAHAPGMVEHAIDHARLLCRRHGDINHLDGRIVEQRLERRMHAGNGAQRRDLARPSRSTET